MTEQRGIKTEPSKPDNGEEIRETEVAAEDADGRRRHLLNLLKTAAMAGPVLWTLKGSPARAWAAASGGSAVSGGSAGGNTSGTKCQNRWWKKSKYCK